MAPTFPITKNKIRNHFHYFWWQYALLIALSVFGWSMLYTTTRYQSPEHLKIEWFYEGITSSQTYDKVAAMMEEARQQLFPEQEEMSFVVAGTDETYGDMQLMVWTAAGQGDLYMLTQEKFKNLAQSGAMIDLQEYIDNGTLNVGDLDLSAGYVTDVDTGKKVLRGIPTDGLQGFLNYDVDPNGKVMSVLYTGGNIDNTLKLINHYLTIMK